MNCFSQSAYFDLRSLEAPDMMVELARSLDREDSPSYQVTLFCQDNGSPRLNATASFTVDVQDVNDNPPVFREVDVTISFPEGDRVGEIVYTVTATDRDLGQNAEVSYQLLNVERNKGFYVLGPSGSIVVARELDRETEDEYVLHVLAVDGGTPQYSATATVTIQVEDRNDEVPVFTRDEYVFYIKENEPAGSFLGVFNATDPDLGDGGKVSFFLSSSQPLARSSFLLHPNGTLVTKATLDRESSPEIVFDVMATDGGSPRLSSSREVTVVLQDVNDNKPVFLFPGVSNHSLTLLIPVKQDAHLFQLSVEDADEGRNSALSYSLASVNLTAMFSVDAWTGDVWARKALTEDHLGVYNLMFRATDGGDSPLSSVGSLFLTIKLNPDSQPIKAGDNNAVIAISIVCATVFIAVVIIIVVYLVRRRDKGKGLQYVNKVNNNNNNEKLKTSSSDPYIERQNTPSMFFTSSSGNQMDRTISPKLTIGFPQEVS